MSTTESDVRAAIAALPTSNGIPEGQQIGGIVDLPGEAIQFTSRLLLPPCVILRGRRQGTLLYGTLSTNIVEHYNPGGPQNDSGVIDMNVRNFGAGGCVGIAAETAGDCNGLLHSGLSLRSLGCPMNMRHPNAAFSTFGVRLIDLNIYGSRTHYIDLAGAVFKTDGVRCVNNRETPVVTPNEVCLFDGEGSHSNLWIEGYFLSPLMRCRTGSQSFDVGHFEPHYGTDQGVAAQFVLEGTPPTNTHPATYHFQRIAFVQPTIPIQVVDKVLIQSGYFAFERSDGGPLDVNLRATAIILPNGSGSVVYGPSPDKLVLGASA